MDLFFRFMAHDARFKHIRRFVASFRIHREQLTEVLVETCERETQQIRARQAPFPVGSPMGILLRNWSRLERAAWYVLQGDLIWLLGRIPDRVRSYLGSSQATGPRSRWM
jgi:hypothetical protein